MSRTSVLISGLGIAGPTLAYWLSSAGFEVTIVERATALRTGGYVIDFWGGGYDVAERMGLIAEIDRVGYRMREVRVVNHSGRRLAGFETRVLDRLTDGRFVTLPRSELSRVLLRRAQEAAEVIFGDEVVALREERDHVRVSFRSRYEREFDLVIGADGLHSRIRELVFGPQNQFEKSLGYAVAALQVTGYRPRDEDVYVMYNRPGRMIGRVTLRNDRTLFLFLFPAEKPQAASTLGKQKLLLREHFSGSRWEWPQIAVELDHTDDLYFDRVSQIRMPSWSLGRAALVGDAAFCVSLAAGQGSALAMISAYVLARELAHAGGDHRKAFRAYETQLRAFIEKKQRGAERFAAALAPKTGAGLRFRNLVMNVLAVPGMARIAIGHDISDSITLPDWTP
jgi:2-polyprenyl-6-methoxyphenol hydroxylase-like FAD-dependent oxidoreductase